MSTSKPLPPCSSCLTLADELKEATIEKVMGKSDVELAIEVLSGKRKP